MTQFLTRYYRFILVLILAWAFFTRIYRLEQPTTYVFDEVYHGVTSKLIARNDERAYEWWNPPVEPNTAVDWLHPPYAKYTQAASILLFGENSFGWRISSVFFGVLVIVAIFKLADVAFGSKPLALTAALIGSLDGLLLVQSRIAMNDIHVTFFILLTVIAYLIYWKRDHSSQWLLATGICAGLAVGTKWSGAYILGLVGLVEGLTSVARWWKEARAKKLHASQILVHLLLMLFTLVLLPIALYLASYTHMYFQGKGWQHLYELHQQIWWYQTNLTATHAYQSRPWQWFLNLRPVWYHVDYSHLNKSANIYAFGNPAVLWGGVLAVVATMASLVLQLWQRKKVSWSLFMILASYLIVWVPWQFSPRIMFFYHYTPAVPFLAILLAYWLRAMWHHKLYLVVIGVLLSMCVTFGLWYPNWTDLPVPTSFANQLYFAIDSWK